MMTIDTMTGEHLGQFIDEIVEELNAEINPDEQGEIQIGGIREPDDWTVGIIGSKGSLKTLLLVRFILKALMCDVKSFSNLIIKPKGWKGNGAEYLEGKRSNDLQIDDLIKFNEDPGKLMNSFLGIDEIRTWFETMRASANTQIVLANWSGQTRKGAYKFMWTALAHRMPPAHLVESTDVIIYARDYCFSPWGIEHNLPRGCIGKYVAIDKSGYFTGIPGTRKIYYLHHAERFWECYETGQFQDPHAFARKTTYSGNEMDVDLEAMRRDDEMRQLKSSSDVILETAIMQHIMSNLSDLDGRIDNRCVVIKSSMVEDAIARQPARCRKPLTESWNSIIAQADKGQIVRIDGKNRVKIALPEFWEEQ